MATPEQIEKFYEEIANGNIAYVKYFLEKYPSEVDARHNQKTPLMTAAGSRCSIQIVEMLLQANADPDARDDLDNPPLAIALDANGLDNMSIAKLIFKALKEKYRTDPAKLNEALGHTSKNVRGGWRIVPDNSLRGGEMPAIMRNALLKEIREFRERLLAPTPEVLDTKAPEPSMFSPSDAYGIMMAARINTALPELPKGNALTLEVLLQKPEGQAGSLLEIYTLAGKLGAIFTSDIWAGRREEMNAAWEHVPPQYHEQIDIETIRGQLVRHEQKEKRAVRTTPHL
jgi:hypothetical protein